MVGTALDIKTIKGKVSLADEQRVAEFVEKKFNIWGGLGSQYDFLAIDGSIDLDYLLRFENLNSDFDKLCKNLDIPGLSLATYNGPFKKDSRHARKHYREYYNEYDMKIIEAVYKKDIDYFDYKF